MSNLFWGFFFIMLDFNITSGNSVIGLIPDFIGFILIYQGLNELQNFSTQFAKIRPLVLVMVLFKVITYVMDLVGISAQIQTVLFPVGILYLVIDLYIEYSIICGLQDMERIMGIDLNTKLLFSAWKAVVVFCVLSYVSLLIPGLAIIFIILSAMTNLIFLLYLDRSKKLYEQNRKIE